MNSKRDVDWRFDWRWAKENWSVNKAHARQCGRAIALSLMCALDCAETRKKHRNPSAHIWCTAKVQQRTERNQLGTHVRVNPIVSLRYRTYLAWPFLTPQIFLSLYHFNPHRSLLIKTYFNKSKLCLVSCKIWEQSVNYLQNIQREYGPAIALVCFGLRNEHACVVGLFLIYWLASLCRLAYAELKYLWRGGAWLFKFGKFKNSELVL